MPENIPEVRRLLTRRQMLELIAYTGTSALLAACNRAVHADTPAEAPIRKAAEPVDAERNKQIEYAIGNAQAFLHNRFDKQTGLLQESPETESKHFWIKTSNYLAARALQTTGDEELAGRINAKMAEYGDQPHGVVEILAGEPIAWPPTTAHVTELNKYDNGMIVYAETRTGGNVMNDWRDYADLCLLGALDASNEGDIQEAQARYSHALSMFNGTGFADKPYQLDEAPEGKRFNTYKLALGLLVGYKLGITNDQTRQMSDILLGMQNSENGGFTTMYVDAVTPVGDANVETTSYSMLALSGVTS